MQSPLIEAARAWAGRVMSEYDAAHDVAHAERVAALAQQLLATEHATLLRTSTSAAAGRGALEALAAVDAELLVVAALLHDVGDRRYTADGRDALRAELTAFSFANKLTPQRLLRLVCIAEGVSFRGETAVLAAAAAGLSPSHRLVMPPAPPPELAFVQDADRLDALGATGVMRAFLHAGAHGETVEDTLAYLRGKLLGALPMRLKTAAGRAAAVTRLGLVRSFFGQLVAEGAWPAAVPLPEAEGENANERDAI